MALEIKVGTDNAEANLKALEASLASVEAAFNRVGNTKSGLDQTLASVAAFRGLNTGAVSSVNSLASALDRLSRGSDLTQFINSMSKINSVSSSNIANVAATVRSLANELSGITFPAAIPRIIQGLGQIAQYAPAAQAQLAGVARAAASIPSIAPQLNQTSGALRQKAQAAQQATTSIFGLGSATSVVTGVIAGFGLSLGGSAFAQFIKGAYEAARTVDAFNTKMTMVLGAGPQVAASLAIADKAAKELAIPLDVARSAWGKLATSMHTAGFEAEDAVQVFRGFGTVFRVIGLSADEMKRGFNAVDQAVSKGTISSEEFRQQLGELFPAINELAASMGKSPQELIKAMGQGTVSSRELIKMSESLIDKYGKALPTALKTFSAGMILVTNETQHFSEAVGHGFDVAVPALNELAKAMDSQAFRDFGTLVGAAVGSALNALASAAAFAASNIETLGPIFLTVAGTIGVLLAVGLVGTIAEWVISISVMKSALWLVQGAAYAGAGALAAFNLATSGIAGLATVALGVAAAIAVLTFGFQPLADAASWVWKKLVDLAQALGLYEPVANAVAAVSEKVAEQFSWITKSSGGAAEALTKHADATHLASGAHEKLILTLDSGRTSFERLTDATVSFGSEMDSLGSRASDLNGELDYTGSSLKNVQSFMWDASNASDDLSSGFLKSASAAEQAANGYNSAAASADHYATAASRASGGSSSSSSGRSRSDGGYTGGSDGSGFTTNFDFSQKNSLFSSEGTFSSFAGGGYSHAPTRFTSGSAGWFHSSTPQFANGGASGGATFPGGGIPSILHPNEAVVPLKGGGSIPVTGIQGFGGPMAQSLISLTREHKQETSRVWEQVHALAIITQNGIDKLAKSVDLLSTNVLTLANRPTSSGGSSGGIGSSSGGGYSGGGGGGGGNTSGETIYGMTFAAFKALKPADRAGVVNQWVKAHGGDVRGGGSAIGLGYTDDSGKIQVKEPVAARLGSPNLYNEIRGFETGSPNAGKDTYGGFVARLHPNEAVVPLPDGRSVPVTFNDSFMERVGLERESRSSSRAGRESAEPKVVRPDIKVYMTVNTKDADSFKKSQAQIMQDLQVQLDRSARQIGRGTDRFDPTKRTG